MNQGIGVGKAPSQYLSCSLGCIYLDNLGLEDLISKIWRAKWSHYQFPDKKVIYKDIRNGDISIDVRISMT